MVGPSGLIQLVMPNYLSDGDTPSPNDDCRKALQKWNNLLYLAIGNVGPTFFPEGSEPKESDDERRSLQKIVALLQ